MDDDVVDLAMVEAQAEPAQEKMIPASKVTQMIQSERIKALEKGRREASFLNQAPQTAESPPMSGDEMRNLVAEETRRVQEQLYQQQVKEAADRESQRIVGEFRSKLAAGKDKYADFDEVIDESSLPSIAYIAQLANEVDNTADVMYEVMKNPSKIASLMVLGQTNPALAKRQMKQLSESIKSNEKALSQKAPAQPLSHLRPSNVSSDNGSPSSVSDFKRMSWLKG